MSAAVDAVFVESAMYTGEIRPEGSGAEWLLDVLKPGFIVNEVHNNPTVNGIMVFLTLGTVVRGIGLANQNGLTGTAIGFVY